MVIEICIGTKFEYIRGAYKTSLEIFDFLLCPLDYHSFVAWMKFVDSRNRIE